MASAVTRAAARSTWPPHEGLFVMQPDAKLAAGRHRRPDELRNHRTRELLCLRPPGRRSRHARAGWTDQVHDAGRTWTVLSRGGESNFHALAVSSAGVMGFDGALRVTADGKSWTRAA